MSASKAYRASLGIVKSQVHVWIPLDSNDRKEGVVLIWGDEEVTKPDGMAEKTNLHEA